MGLLDRIFGTPLEASSEELQRQLVALRAEQVASDEALRGVTTDAEWDKLVAEKERRARDIAKLDFLLARERERAEEARRAEAKRELERLEGSVGAFQQKVNERVERFVDLERQLAAALAELRAEADEANRLEYRLYVHKRDSGLIDPDAPAPRADAMRSARGTIRTRIADAQRKERRVSHDNFEILEPLF